MHAFLFCLLLIAPPEREALTVPTVQAISLLGDSLYTVELEEGPFRTAEFKYLKALRRYNKKPDDIENLVWLGRRLGYLGHFSAAIEVYTEGLELWPQDARLYRHRGHRYISTRQFEKAIADLQKASELMPDSLEIEPDGLPNQQGVPRTTLQYNVWYHLGLAHYLSGNFAEAAEAYDRCLQVSDNNDCQVSTRYWSYLTQRKLGSDGAGLLDPVVPNMYLIENTVYQRLGLLLKGTFPPDSVLVEDPGSLNGATKGYGLAMWKEFSGDAEGARTLKKSLQGPRQWSAFGAIAAEADLAREISGSAR